MFGTGDSSKGAVTAARTVTFAGSADVITDFNPGEGDSIVVGGEVFDSTTRFQTGAPGETPTVGNAWIDAGKFLGNGTFRYWYVSGVWDGVAGSFQDTDDGPDYLLFDLGAARAFDPVNGTELEPFEALILDDAVFNPI